MEIIISSFRLKSPRNWGRQSGIFQSKSLLQFGRMSFCETSCAWHHYGGRCTLHSSKHASTTIWQFLKMHKLTYLILVWLKIGETMAYGIPSKYQFYLNRRKDDMPMDSGFSPQFSDKLIWQLPRAPFHSLGNTKSAACVSCSSSKENLMLHDQQISAASPSMMMSTCVC